MRVGGFFFSGALVGIVAIGATAAWAQDQATQEKALEGTYTQNQACKGDGSDKKLVVIHEKRSQAER